MTRFTMAFVMLVQIVCAGENIITNTGKTMGENIKKMKLEMKYNGARFAVLLEDNPASRELIAQLPLELEFSDYAQKEKIAHLPKPISVKNTPNYNPQIGDVFYFAPWGNIGIFYDKQPPFNGLVYLGKILHTNNSDDIETLKNIKGNFVMRLDTQEP